MHFSQNSIFCCLVTKSCPILLWPPQDYSPPGSSVYRISQARTLGWVDSIWKPKNLSIDSDPGVWRKWEKKMFHSFRTHGFLRICPYTSCDHMGEHWVYIAFLHEKNKHRVVKQLAQDFVSTSYSQEWQRKH